MPTPDPLIGQSLLTFPSSATASAISKTMAIGFVNQTPMMPLCEIITGNATLVLASFQQPMDGHCSDRAVNDLRERVEALGLDLLPLIGTPTCGNTELDFVLRFGKVDRLLLGSPYLANQLGIMHPRKPGYLNTVFLIVNGTITALWRDTGKTGTFDLTDIKVGMEPTRISMPTYEDTDQEVPLFI